MEKADKPLMVQSDLTVLLEANNPRFREARNMLTRFAFLLKTPELIHTYRITPLSLWNAASSGLTGERIIAFLNQHCRHELPQSCRDAIKLWHDRYGLFQLVQNGGTLVLLAKEPEYLEKVAANPAVRKCLADMRVNIGTAAVCPDKRGELKRAMISLGFPVIDKAGCRAGEALAFRLRETTTSGAKFALRPYQLAALSAFVGETGEEKRSGMVVLPCGAGKTIVGIAAMSRLQCATLILTASVASARQWKDEILGKTTLTEAQVGEYSGERKEVKPVTIATYQIVTHRKSRNSVFLHMRLFHEREWGLIIYDEAHLLPAPVFRVTAALQAARRLGLTATLVREDGCEEDVFSLIGPKLYELPWRDMEEERWIAAAYCAEVRVPFPDVQRELYRGATARAKVRIAGENPAKVAVLRELLRRHRQEQILIIGQFLSQLQTIARDLRVPLITGKTPQAERENLYRQFRARQIPILIVSKVANFAIDLPDAAVAVQVSGSFGSRQEEAQRLGRILRPKAEGNKAYFYSLVTEGSCEQDFALKRKLFLAEQGYQYAIERVFGEHMLERVSL
ncbi:MAG TPA: DNA repair helicase XPB [Bacilli bacterium]